MVERVLGVLEVATVVVAAAATARFAFGSDPDPTTAGMVALVALVWLAYRRALWLWLQDRPWLGEVPSDEAELPVELTTAMERVEASTVEYGGKRWRTVSAALEIGSDGASTGSLRLPALLATGQGVLISLGLIGTFLGLTLGLMSAVPKLTAADRPAVAEQAASGATAGQSVAGPSSGDDRIAGMQDGMEDLLGGARLAFAKSVAGVAFAMLWGLRLRHAEARRDEHLDALAEELDRRWPLLTSQQIHLDAAAKANEILEKLVASATAEGARAEARGQELQSNVARLGEAMEKRVDELVVTMQDLSEALPAAIGSQTGNQVLQLLAPQFGALVNEMKKLTEGGNDQISKAMLGKADAEVSSLKRALADVVETLGRLPADYTSHMKEVQDGMKGAMGTVGTTVTDASANLSGVSGDLRATIVEIGRILPEVRTAAAALHGAGERVREGLEGVAAPLLGLPPALDATRAALEGATVALGASEVALGRHAKSAGALNEAVGAQQGVMSAATTRAEALVGQIDRLGAALGASESRLGQLTAAQSAANGEAVAELGRSLTAFQAALEGMQRSMETGSRGALEKAEGVSLAAAQRVADALGRGAVEFETAMKQLAAHSATMETSMTAARDTANALVGHAAALRDGITEVARPLGPIAIVLSGVPASVQAASQALHTEHSALQGLGAQLREQAAMVKVEQEALGARIEQYRQLNGLLGREMASHLQGIAAANDQVRSAWAEATGKSKEVIEANARQLGAYAQQVEQALRLPGDLRRLDQTIGELSDVLDDLRSVLADSGSHHEPDRTA